MRLPPALNVALLTTLSLLAGCLEPVGSGDPDAAAAIDAVDEAVQGLTDQSGHIAGTVAGDDGAALAGVHVVLDGTDAADTDEQGRFAFVDVASGEHTLAAHKDGYSDPASVIVPVAAKDIARPALVLAKIVPPTTFETTVFTFYQEFSLIGLELGCSCFDEVPLGDAATEAVLEVVTENNLVLGGYRYDAVSYVARDNGTEYLGSQYGVLYEGSPSLVPGEVLAGASTLAVHVSPDVLGAAAVYRVYVTVFHNGPAPEGFTAVE